MSLFTYNSLSQFQLSALQYLKQMYGRNNIFSGNSSGGSYNSSNYNSNNYGSNSNYRNNNSRAIGSYRLQYRYQEPPSYLSSYITQWKQQPPASIVTRQETLHMTTTQLRIEDYYIIRKKQLKSSHETRLKDAIRGQCFNEQILKYQFEKLPPVSDQRPVDIDALRNARNSQGSNQSYRNNSDSNRGNIFSNNSSNNVSNNIFSQNSNSRYGNSSNSGGNIFSSGNRGGSGTSGNIFSNSSGNSNNYNTRGSGNIFSNNNSQNNSYNSNNNSSNIFSRNNNTSGNIFSSNNNNNSNNNIFGNRSSNNNNIFNNNSGGNNIFSGNCSGGNNLFSGNNNNNNGLPPEILLNLQYALEQNVKIMQSLQQKNQTKDQAEQQSRNMLSPFEELANRSDPLDVNRFLQYSRKNQNRQQNIVFVKPPWFEEYQNMRSSQISNQSKLFSNSKVISNSNSMLINNQNRSRIISNDNQKNVSIRGTESRIIPNHKNQEGSVSRSVFSSSLKMNNTLQEWQGQCMCEFDLQIQWEDDERKQMGVDKIKGILELENLKPSGLQWKRQVVRKLKHAHSIVRVDADLLIMFCKEKESTASAQFVLKGRLRQRIINLPQNYSVCYSQIQRSMIYNLTISNEFGSIAWWKPINAKALDFMYTEDLIPFSIGQNEVTCQLEALNSKCTVSFVGLPKQVEESYEIGESPNNQDIRKKFANFVSQSSNGAFQFTQIWKTEAGSGWSMLVKYFPKQQLMDS